MPTDFRGPHVSKYLISGVAMEASCSLLTGSMIYFSLVEQYKEK